MGIGQGSTQKFRSNFLVDTRNFLRHPFYCPAKILYDALLPWRECMRAADVLNRLMGTIRWETRGKCSVYAAALTAAWPLPFTLTSYGGLNWSVVRHRWHARSQSSLNQAHRACRMDTACACSQRIPGPLQRCWTINLHADSIRPLPMGKPRAMAEA